MLTRLFKKIFSGSCYSATCSDRQTDRQTHTLKNRRAIVLQTERKRFLFVGNGGASSFVSDAKLFLILGFSTYECAYGAFSAAQRAHAAEST